MRIVLGIGNSFATILRRFADIGRALADFIGRFVSWFTRHIERCRMSDHDRSKAAGECVPIRRPEFNRPDPLIYAQFYLMHLGLAVTWDNPDISIETPPPGPPQPHLPPDPGRTVPSHALMPDTDYDIVARVWNGSTEAPALGLPVRFSYLSFGAGTQSHGIGVTLVDLGVKGGPGAPAYARVRWRTPAQLGHYCIQVLLDWADDFNPANNLGQENTNVVSAQSPAVFAFRLRNEAAERRAFHFAVDGYTLPAAPSCTLVVREREAEKARRGRRPEAAGPVIAGRPSTFDPPVVAPVHRAGNHPLPAGWAVLLDPATPDLAPGEEIAVTATITPPDSFHGRQPVNVNALHRTTPVGGVTVVVTRE